MIYLSNSSSKIPKELFSDKNLDSIIDTNKRKIKQEIANKEDFNSLDSSVEEMINEYSIEVALIDEVGIKVSNKDTKVDVAGNFSRGTEGMASLFIQGTEYKFHIPFSGNPDYFLLNPFSLSLSAKPIGRIQGNEIIISLYTTHDADDPKKVRASFDEELKKLNSSSQKLKLKIENYNRGLESFIRPLIEERIEKLKNDTKSLNQLGFPLKKYQTTPEIYTVPIKKKNIVPRKKILQDSGLVEHQLSEDAYDEILDMLHSMSLVIERSPSAFAHMNEEHIRFVLLIPLNTQFKGQARGEVFNAGGKTDILISHENRNIFIAECKFWKGAKHFQEAIDQLLGYITWRDSKTAILIFNKKKNTSKILERIPSLVKTHKAFSKNIDYESDSGFRFEMSHPNDDDKKFLMTVMMFDIPEN